MNTKQALYKIKKKLLNMWQLFWLQKQKHKISRNAKIRIGFLVQMPEVWDSESGLYEEFKSRTDCEVVMIVVPPYDFSHSHISKDYSNNYFLTQYPEAVRAFDENGEVINIRSLNLDYVFYQRPYDHYLPTDLKSYMMMRYAKCCYIPYGYSFTDDYAHLLVNPLFYPSLYFAFPASENTLKIMEKPVLKRINQGLQHFEYLGYPPFEPFLELQKPQQSRVKTVLWTPRWSYNSRIGGSHFFEYKDYFLELNNIYPELKCVFRPHPMMFEEFEKKGLMSAQDISDFISLIESNGIDYDHGIPVLESFKKTDLLITDISAIMIPFFITGRPMIYCDSGCSFSEAEKDLQECIYIARNLDELKYYVKEIERGNDYLFEKRQALIRREFSKSEDSVKRIARRIMKDFEE